MGWGGGWDDKHMNRRSCNELFIRIRIFSWPVSSGDTLDLTPSIYILTALVLLSFPLAYIFSFILYENELDPISHKLPNSQQSNFLK